MQELHEVQHKILTNLLKQESGQKYARLQIPKIENDLYNYHLQTLVRNDYVKKNGELYELTKKGKQYITQINVFGDIKEMFKVSVALAVFRDNYRKVLIQERLRHPFYGDTTSIAGKIHKGELSVDAAKRKLKEEAGLEADFLFVGILRKIRRDTDNKVIEDTFYHYCVAHEPKGEFIEQNEFGKNFWIPSSEIIKYEQKNIDVGDQDIFIWKRMISKNFNSFYLEQDKFIESY